MNSYLNLIRIKFQCPAICRLKQLFMLLNKLIHCIDITFRVNKVMFRATAKMFGLIIGNVIICYQICLFQV